MAATYMHIGIPVLNKKPNMVYNEWGKFWVNESVDAYDYKIEYLKFEEGTCFPEILSKQPHVAYKVDNMDPYIVIQDDAIIELYEEKSGPAPARRPPRRGFFPGLPSQPNMHATKGAQHSLCIPRNSTKP